MHLDAHGFSIDLPPGWEGAVRRAPTPARRVRGRAVSTMPVVHLSTAPLPSVRGDFGSGAVDLLGEQDVFVALLEYGPESVGTPLFATGPMPRTLRVDDFSPRGLQRTIAGQCGTQVFCTEAGRALCLYVVLGTTRRPRPLVRRVNEALTRIEVAPA